MDVISHGFWGGISFGRGGKKLFLLAFLFGVLPDIIPFGFIFITRVIPAGFNFVPTAQLPAYIFSLYNITHSLIVALALLAISLFIWRRRAWLAAAWPLHIIFDIFSHDLDFFPTPYLWPFSTPLVPGMPWVNLKVFVANWVLLLILYAAFFLMRKKQMTIDR